MHPLFPAPLLETLKDIDLRAVGGSTRAYLRHDPLTNLDLDYATSATPQAILQACLQNNIPTSVEGLKWGTVTLHLPETSTIEITTLRTETYTPGSRYPTIAFTQSWEADAARRDFTINAIYISPDNAIYDPFDGQTDLKNGIVRFIGNPMQRLSEDPLRLIRFFRFCGHYGLGGLTPELIECFTAAAPAITSLSRSRLQLEWAKLQKTPQAQTIQTELERLNLLTIILNKIT